MLDFLEQVPAEWRPFALFIFVALGAGGAALSYLRGKKTGPEAPKVQEFYATGTLYDMGPVKELVEQTGLLVQQQVRTNMHLEAHTRKQGQTALALHALARQVGRLADAYEAQITADRNDAEIEDEVDRRVERQLRERRTRAHRVAPKRKPADGN